MLRTLALVLLVANALLAAALAGLFDGLAGGAASAQREPQRLQRQHQPELVRILPPPAASAALAAAAASAAQAAAASQANAPMCMEAGPFAGPEAEAAERTLRDAGLAAGSWQALRQDVAGAFMIYMGRYADRETLQRKLDEVKRLKLAVEDLRHQPELQPGLSLGRFDSKPDADAAMARMAKGGLRTARVITLRQAQSQVMLRVPVADATLRARLAGLQWPSGPGFLPCSAETAVASAPGASTAASAAVTPAASAPVAAAATVAPASRLPTTGAAPAAPASPVQALKPAAAPAAQPAPASAGRMAPPPAAASRPAAASAAARPASPAAASASAASAAL